MVFNTVLWLVIINLILGLLLFLILKKNYFLAVLYIGASAYVIYKFPYIDTLQYFFAPHIVLALIAHFLTTSKKAQEDIFNVVIHTEQGEKIIENIDRGVSVFGSAGSGKSESVINSFLVHYKKFDFSGLAHDYKNGELTEYILSVFGADKVRIIAPHDPEISNRINFFRPDYLTDEIIINDLVKVLLINLLGIKDKSDFFLETAEGLLSAVVLKFSLDHKEYCTFPHICAFLTTNDFGGYREVKYFDMQTNSEATKLEFSEFKKLEDFLNANVRVKIQASSFLKGLASERQTASVISTLLNALRKISSPKFFYVFSGNDFDFNINDENNRLIVSILNQPENENVVTPLIACTINIITKAMMKREQKQAFFLMDEGATIKLPNMARIPATMRSFKIATLYATQDISQGYVQYGQQEFKQILSNLNTQIFGKANDPDTAQFYERYIEFIEEKHVSTSKDAEGFFGTTKSVNISKKEQRKIRAIEFQQLKVGEFVQIVNGESDKVKYDRTEVQPIEIYRRKIDEREILLNFNKIILESQKLI